jgi:hypothetical protein
MDADSTNLPEVQSIYKHHLDFQRIDWILKYISQTVQKKGGQVIFVSGFTRIASQITYVSCSNFVNGIKKILQHAVVRSIPTIP